MFGGIIEGKEQVLLPFEAHHHAFDCLQQPSAIFRSIFFFVSAARFDFGAHCGAALSPYNSVRRLEVAVEGVLSSNVVFYFSTPDLLLELAGACLVWFAGLRYDW